MTLTSISVTADSGGMAVIGVAAWGVRIAALLVLVACGPQGSTLPANPLPDLGFEITPATLGARTPGDLPELTVAIVNRSTTHTYVLPNPHRDAHQGLAGTFYFEYERALPDGTWEDQPRTFLLGCGLGENDPHATLELPPGARVILDRRAVPQLTFAEDVVGTMRARLVFDVDAEWERRKATGEKLGKLISNTLELDQLAGPFEVKLEAIGPITAGKDLDLPRVLRVTVRNRSAEPVTIRGPGEHSGIGFDIYTPNGGVWPKGDRPEMGVAPGAGRTHVLSPGEVIEIFGPNAALGPDPGTWNYPVAERFRLRANFYQPAPHRFHYSDWVELESVN